MASAAELLFLAIQTDGEKEINRLIAANEETPLLDFKEKSDADGTVTPSRDDLSNYSKALSGFANATGGLLIWGVGEVKAPTSGKKMPAAAPISSPEAFRQSLEHNLPTSVSRAVQGVQNVTIPASSLPGKGFVVTYVPESDEAPHRAEGKEKRYYRRVGSNFIQMDHHEIEDLFGRRQRPKLEVSLCFKKHPNSTSELHHYTLLARVTNTGRGMARFYKVVVGFPTAVLEHPSGGLHKQGTVLLVHIATTLPLFPGDFHLLNFDAKPYHMCRDIFDGFQRSGWPMVTIEAYADSAPPLRREMAFRTELSDF